MNRFRYAFRRLAKLTGGEAVQVERNARHQHSRLGDNLLFRRRTLNHLP